MEIKKGKDILQCLSQKVNAETARIVSSDYNARSPRRFG